MKLKVAALFLVLAGVFVFFVFRGGYLQPAAPPAPVTDGLTAAATLEYLQANEWTDYEGKKFKTGQLASGQVIVHLWASWCGPCVNEIPELIEFSKKNPDVKFVIASLDENQADIAKFLKSFPELADKKFISIWDRENALAKFFRADLLPMSIVLSKNRADVRVIRSVVDWKSLTLE